MSSFKPLNIKKYHKTEKVITPDTVYWKRLSKPTLVKEFGAIDYIDCSPIEPHYFAVTCSVRVQIYNPITKLVVKNLSRFQETAYGGTYRQDGRLLVAGDEQGLVKLFDTSSKNVLRLFKGHKAPVHRTFFTSNLLNIASYSDDKTVKLWDIANERVVHTYEEHGDYVRAGAVNPAAADVILSGGYDGLIKMYDTRAKEVSFSIDHGSPVESLLFLPTGGIFISTGGTEVRVWDAFAGCRLLTKLSQHHKTVTCLRLGSNGKRILSGGLDRHVKIYDVATYQTVHTLDYPNAVLSLGVAPNDQVVVAGMVDGLISIQNMEAPTKQDANDEALFRTAKPQIRNMVHVDQRIMKERLEPLKLYDKYLRKYAYGRCLDEVLKVRIMFHSPEVTVAVMQELIQRKGLARALVGRTHKSLLKIVTFLRRHIGEHRFMRVLLDVGATLLDVYEERFHEFDPVLLKQFQLLAAVVEKEVELTYDLLELQGALELLLDAADVTNDRDEMIYFVDEENIALKQSARAKESSTVTV